MGLNAYFAYTVGKSDYLFNIIENKHNLTNYSWISRYWPCALPRCPDRDLH